MSPEAQTETEIPKRLRVNTIGFDDITAGFHILISHNPDLLDYLPPKQSQLYRAFIKSPDNTPRRLAPVNKISPHEAETRIMSAIANLHDALPEDIRTIFDPKAIQVLRIPAISK